MFHQTAATRALFVRVTEYPKSTLAACILCIVFAAIGLGKLVKDTSVKAFIPDDHPALIADEKAREIFGLSDTIAISLTVPGGTVFEPEVLDTIAMLTAGVAELPNIRADRVVSLATESAIRGDNGAIEVVPYVDPDGMTAELAAASAANWQSMPPHHGTLVSDDEMSAVIMADVVDTNAADATYHDVLALTEALDLRGLRVDVAGPAAVSSYLSSYIDADASRLQPLVFLLVLGFIYLAFRRLAAVPGPLFVVIGAAGGALGVMAWLDVPYYAITNALPVIIVAISVADAIHVLSAYFELRSRHPDRSVRELTVDAMTEMARPITLTTLTTIAGFVGIGAVSVMPPIAAFAWFASLGVALAWLFSLVALPNLLVLMRLGPSPAFRNWREDRPSGLGRLLGHIGALSAQRYPLVLVAAAAAVVVTGYGASQLRIDRSQVENFPAGETVRVADTFINERFAGTAFLDILVETPAAEGLIDAARMQRIADLQRFAESLPHVSKTVAITDYLGVLHEAIDEQPITGTRPLPDADDAIAQYLLLYEVSGDPADFEEEIDYDYRHALVRVVLDTHYFSESRAAVEALEDYVATDFNGAGLSATLAGDVAVSYHWMRQLEDSHFRGVGLSLLLVLAAAIAFFRSLSSGVIAVVPVTFAVATMYAVMGYAGLYLEPASSMFAAIALGVGVDFGIHLVDRLRRAHAMNDDDLAAAVDEALPPTARACFFNSAALGLGFAVLMTSSLPTLQRFGGLVTIAAFSSYIAALVLVPALFAVMHGLRRRLRALARREVVGGLALLTLVPAWLLAGDVSAETPDAATIAQRVYDRAEGRATHRVLEITLTDRRGREKSRQAVVVRESRDDARVTRITYTEPKAIRDTAFLSHDFHETARDDSRWFYTPALRKDRRVPASDRGDYFLGTDFTYEDIQSEFKFSPDDYRFERLGDAEHDGRTLPVIAGHPIDARTARETGYGRIVATIDTECWMPVRIEFFDRKDRPLKTVVVGRIEAIDGVWVARDIRALNHRSEHSTRFEITEVGFVDDIDDDVFEPRALARGLGKGFVAGAQ